MEVHSIFGKFTQEKQTQIFELLDQPVLARLATANPRTCQPHVVPLWYLWDGENVWISGFRNTRKFKDLNANPKCALLIEPANPKESQIQAILFEGPVKNIREDRHMIIQISTEIYLRYLGKDGIQEAEPQSWIHDPQNLVVQLKPTNAFVW